MSPLSRFRARFGRPVVEDVQEPSVAMTATGVPSHDQNTTSKITGTGAIAPINNDIEPGVEEPVKDLLPTEGAQKGVQEVEAVTLTWTRPYLIAVFIL